MNPVQTLDWTISETTSCIRGSDDRMQRMQIRHEEIESDIGLIHLAGRLDIMGVQKIELKFAAITSAQRKSVIVDLSQVELMNSIGLGLLITNANVMKAQGNVMILLKPQSRVERVIRIAGLDELLTIEYDLNEAIKRVKALGLNG